MNDHTKISVYGIGIAIFLFMLPFVTSRHLFYGEVNAKYFYIVGVLSVALLFFCYSLFTCQRIFIFRGRWLVWSILLFLGVLYLTSFLGVYPERSFLSDLTRGTGVFFITYIALFSLCLSELLRNRDWSIVRWAVAVSATLVSFSTILGAEGLHLAGRFFTVNLSISGATFGNSTFAGTYLLFAFALTLIELFKTDARRNKLILGFLLLLQFLSPVLFNIKILLGKVALSSLANPFVFLGSARASSAALFAIILFILGVILIRRFISKKPALNLVWAGLWIFAIGVSLFLLFTPGSAVQERYIQESTAARIVVWDSAWEAFKVRPLLGWGPENFRIAFEHHFDNRLYESANLGEVWFDRAHNIFLDALVSIGIIGFVAGVLAILAFIWIVIHATRRGLISVLEGNVLGALMVAHILQLQTGFNTTATYVILGLVFAYALWLEKKMIDQQTTFAWTQKMGAVGLGLLVVIASYSLFFSQYVRQNALYRIFVTPQYNEQVAYIHKAMTQQSDIEALRIAFASLTKGLFTEVRDQKGRGGSVELILEQVALYGDYWKAYVEAHPGDYRGRMNYAYNLLLQTTFGHGQHLEEAKAIIADSYQYSPENPLTYVLDGVAELYSGNLAAAREKIEEAVAVNPEAEFSQRILAYLERQEASFPEITILQLSNL